MDMIRSKLSEIAPKEFLLSQNFPNPFNPSTMLSVSLPVEAEVRLDIYNALGQHVRSLFSGTLDAGRHWFGWDGKDGSGKQLASGAYYCLLRAPSGRQSVARMLMIK